MGTNLKLSWFFRLMPLDSVTNERNAQTSSRDGDINVLKRKSKNIMPLDDESEKVGAECAIPQSNSAQVKCENDEMPVAESNRPLYKEKDKTDGDMQVYNKCNIQPKTELEASGANKDKFRKEKTWNRRGRVNIILKMILLITVLILVKPTRAKERPMIFEPISLPIEMGNTANFQCCVQRNYSFCNGNSYPRMMKGNTQKALYLNGENTDNSKYDFNVNDCTCLTFGIKAVEERDLDDYTCGISTHEVGISKKQMMNYSISLPQLDEPSETHICSFESGVLLLKLANAFPVPQCNMHKIYQDGGNRNISVEKNGCNGIMCNVTLNVLLDKQEGDIRSLNVSCLFGPFNRKIIDKKFNCNQAPEVNSTTKLNICVVLVALVILLIVIVVL